MTDEDIKPVKNPEFEELVPPEIEMEEPLVTEMESETETVVVRSSA